MITVTLLGTSALTPLPGRNLTAALLECGGRAILFDCGEDTQTAAMRAGVSLMRTDIIALTHYHGDHTFGLPGLLQTLHVMGRTEPLVITGPAGLEEALAPILRLTGETQYELRLLETGRAYAPLRDLLPGWPAEALFASFPTEHRVPSQGYGFILERRREFLPDRAEALGVSLPQRGLLQRGESVRVGEELIRPEQVMGPPRRGLKFVFSGDTVLCDSLIEGARDADLAIFEATFGADEEIPLAAERGHMVFSQAARAAAAAGVRRLWLAHFSRKLTVPEDWLPKAREYFPDAVCGTDGMRVTLTFPPA